MKTLLKSLIFGFTVALCSSCASLQSVSLTQLPKKKKRVVSAQVDRWVILGLVFDNDFVDPMVDDLRSQCRGGQVQGILTKDEAYNYFLWLVYKRKVTAKGYCVKA